MNILEMIEQQPLRVRHKVAEEFIVKAPNIVANTLQVVSQKELARILYMHTSRLSILVGILQYLPPVAIGDVIHLSSINDAVYIDSEVITDVH